MVSGKMFALGSEPSGIRKLFAFGQRRAKEIGAENVFDFSLGNPSIPAPPEIAEVITRVLNEESTLAVHGYTSAAGSDTCREAIANGLNHRFGTVYKKENLFITCGAAPALTSCLRALAADDRSSEFIAIAPYFPEYRVFTESAGGHLTVLPADTEHFQIDFDSLKDKITASTQAVIVNSPNNPSGVVYTRTTIESLTSLLKECSVKFGHPIYLISDEPYRELVYHGVEIPFIPKYYRNTIVCYSFSKSLSLPGERIGYVLVPDGVDDFHDVYNAIAGAARAIGHVCAPSLMQKVVTACAEIMPDVSVYERNARLLYDAMTSAGYRCARPDGAFYLFFEAPNGMTGQEFSDFAKERYNMLIVPGKGFGCPNHLRLSYCVETERIEKALPLLKQMIEDLRR